MNKELNEIRELVAQIEADVKALKRGGLSDKEAFAQETATYKMFGFDSQGQLEIAGKYECNVCENYFRATFTEGDPARKVVACSWCAALQVVVVPVFYEALRLA